MANTEHSAGFLIEYGQQCSTEITSQGKHICPNTAPHVWEVSSWRCTSLPPTCSGVDSETPIQVRPHCFAPPWNAVIRMMQAHTDRGRMIQATHLRAGQGGETTNTLLAQKDLLPTADGWSSQRHCTGACTALGSTCCLAGLVSGRPATS